MSDTAASGVTERIRRAVDLSRLPPGRYELSLQVRRGVEVATSRRPLILRRE